MMITQASRSVAVSMYSKVVWLIGHDFFEKGQNINFSRLSAAELNSIELLPAIFRLNPFVVRWVSSLQIQIDELLLG